MVAGVPASFPQMRRLLTFVQLRQQMRSACDAIGFGPATRTRLCAVLIASAALFGVSLAVAFCLREGPVYAVLQGFVAGILPLSVGLALLVIGDDAQLLALRQRLQRALPTAQLEWEERKSRLRETKESQQKEWGRQAEAAAEEENQRLLRQMPPLPAEQPAPWMGEPQQPAPCKACPFCGAAAPHDAPRCPYCGKTLVVALPAAEEARRAGPQFVVVGAPPDAYRGRVDDYPPAAASNGCLSVFGNVLWVTFGGGLLLFLMYLMGGVALCLTVLGIPFGIQCIKIGLLALLPFGKRVVHKESATGCVATVMNILWLFTGGWMIALTHLFAALFCAITIVLIPFAMQHMKLAATALTPFGKEIVEVGARK